MGEFLDITTAESQRKKLERECEQLQRDPGDGDTALSFFVTAAHLPEWINGPAYKKSLQQPEIIVQICDELANRGKHGRSDRQ